MDDDLNKRAISCIQLVIHKGNALVSDKHPATNIIKNHTEALNQHFEWLKQLSILLAAHTQYLIEYENVK